MSERDLLDVAQNKLLNCANVVKYNKDYDLRKLLHHSNLVDKLNNFHLDSNVKVYEMDGHSSTLDSKSDMHYYHYNASGNGDENFDSDSDSDSEYESDFDSESDSDDCSDEDYSYDAKFSYSDLLYNTNSQNSDIQETNNIPRSFNLVKT